MTLGARTALVGIGSNEAPATHVAAALRALAARFGALSCSAVYASPPLDGRGAPYWNLAVAFETSGDWATLRAALKAVERERGRIRGRAPGAPVTLDLDLLVLRGAAGEVDEYDLPWPAVRRLAHVIVPLAEIAPDWRHPEAGLTLRELADAIRAGGCPLEPVAPPPAGRRPRLEVVT